MVRGQGDSGISWVEVVVRSLGFSVPGSSWFETFFENAIHIAVFSEVETLREIFVIAFSGKKGLARWFNVSLNYGHFDQSCLPLWILAFF